MDDIKGLLRNEIQEEIEALSNLEAGTDEHKSTIDGVTKLMDRFNEMEKLDIERLDKAENRKAEKEKQQIETELKQKQMKDEQIDRWVKTGTVLFTTIGGWMFMRWGAKNAWKFEEHGTITSGPGRKFMDMIFRK
jgi:hypothetical protein